MRYHCCFGSNILPGSRSQLLRTQQSVGWSHQCLHHPNQRDSALDTMPPYPEAKPTCRCHHCPGCTVPGTGATVCQTPRKFEVLPWDLSLPFSDRLPPCNRRKFGNSKCKFAKLTLKPCQEESERYRLHQQSVARCCSKALLLPCKSIGLLPPCLLMRAWTCLDVQVHQVAKYRLPSKSRPLLPKRHLPIRCNIQPAARVEIQRQQTQDVDIFEHQCFCVNGKDLLHRLRPGGSRATWGKGTRARKCCGDDLTSVVLQLLPVLLRT